MHNYNFFMNYRRHFKFLALHIPILGGIVRERDRLLSDLTSVVRERDRLLSDLTSVVRERDRLRSDLTSVLQNERARNTFQHARPNRSAYYADFDRSQLEDNLMPIIGRIQKALSNAINLHHSSPHDVWANITPGHEHIIALLNTNHEEANHYLNRMFTTPLSHGFNQGEIVNKSLIENQTSRDWIAQFALDKLCGLAESFGCVEVENPEQGSWGVQMSKDPEELLAQVSEFLDFKLMAPKFQAGAFGLKTSRGLFTEREFFSILIANTVSRLIPDKNTPICEIGGGGGSLAYYLWQFGFRNITLIDLPTVNIAQAYWLYRNLSDCEITLSGEKHSFDRSPGIRVLSTKYFEQVPDRYFGLVINVDSFPEISAEVVRSYLKHMRKNARLFLSINQEAAAAGGSGEASQLIVHKQIELVGGFHRQYRNPFWLRKGYVEEFYKIEADENPH